MGTQVITIGANGSVSGLQRKPGQGINLQKLGRAETVRASLIEWDVDHQKWWINVLQEAGKGDVSFPLFREATDQTTGEVLAQLNRICQFGHTSEIEIDETSGLCSRSRLMFDDYDDAVRVEIAYLDALRLKGQH